MHLHYVFNEKYNEETNMYMILSLQLTEKSKVLPLHFYNAETKGIEVVPVFFQQVDSILPEKQAVSDVIFKSEIPKDVYDRGINNGGFYKKKNLKLHKLLENSKDEILVQTDMIIYNGEVIKNISLIDLDKYTPLKN